MIPIYEQGDGRGIGHSLDSFLDRFDEIIQEHIESGRAKAFALILYDFKNQNLRRILEDTGVFAKLDRLSGNTLSLFYLHARSRKAVEQFNNALLPRLGLGDKVALPCVVFFRIRRETCEDVAVAQLDNANLIHGFGELYEVVKAYVEKGETNRGKSVAVTWVKGIGKFVGVEVVRAGLREGLVRLPF